MATSTVETKTKPTPTPTPDPSGVVANAADGQGGEQREPKPEDYPASARVTPPLEQLNPALSQAVGAIGDGDVTEALEDGIAAHEKNAAKGRKVAHEIADLRQQLADKLAEQDK